MFPLQKIETKCLPTEVSVVTKTWYRTKTICKRSCPVNQFVFRERCYEDCPKFTSKTDNGFIKYCSSQIALGNLECPDFMCTQRYPYCFNGNCLSSCPEYTVGYNRSCLMKCPTEAPFVTAYSCEGVCYSGDKSCSETCPNSHPYTFQSLHIQHCLSECPDFTRIKGNCCALSCSSDFPLLFNRSCSEKCPITHPFIYLKNTQYNQIFTCVEKCPDQMASYRNVCVSVCPNNTYLEEGAYMKCVEKCGDARPFISVRPVYKKSIYYKECISSCPAGQYALSENIDKICVNVCPQNFSIYNNTCLSKCPKQYPLRNTLSIHGRHTFTCVNECLHDTFNHENMCLTHCPSQLVHYLSNCTSKCLDNYPFLLKHNRTCVHACPRNYVYNENVCDDICPENKSFIEKRTCVVQCSNRHSLHKVSTSGKLCLNSGICPNETFLLNKTNKCISECPRKTHVLINNLCTNISECPMPSFFLDTKYGYRCIQKCSTALFTNGRNCVSQCPENSVVMERNCTEKCMDPKPYKFRNDSLRRTSYFCYSVCPDGYYSYKTECILEDTCRFDKQSYIFNKTCYNKCPPQTKLQSDPYYVCKAVDFQSAYRNLVEIVLCTGVFLTCFYSVCCYKGGIHRCLFRLSEKFKKAHYQKVRHFKKAYSVPVYFVRMKIMFAYFIRYNVSWGSLRIN